MGMLLSLAAMIWSRTTLAASMRACRFSREVAAKAVVVNMKLRQINASVFFISCSFQLRGLSRWGLSSGPCWLLRMLAVFVRASPHRLQHGSRNAHPAFCCAGLKKGRSSRSGLVVAGQVDRGSTELTLLRGEAFCKPW